MDMPPKNDSENSASGSDADAGTAKKTSRLTRRPRTVKTKVIAESEPMDAPAPPVAAPQPSRAESAAAAASVAGDADRAAAARASDSESSDGARSDGNSGG